jgi:hypothetical protein
LSSLKVRFSGGIGTGLIADGKSGDFTLYLGLEMIWVMLNKSNNQMSGLLLPSKP